jgi:endoglucanase
LIFAGMMAVGSITSTPASSLWLTGVNLAGAEFGHAASPETELPYFAREAAWNVPATGQATATAVTNSGLTSATLVTRLLTAGSATYLKCMFSDFTFPVFEATQATPLITLDISNVDGGSVAQGTQIPWDTAWTPSGGQWDGTFEHDAQAIVILPWTGEEYDLWHVKYNAGPNTLSCGHAHKGSESYFTGGGQRSGARSIGVQYMAMLALARELQDSGGVKHALGLAIPNQHNSIFYAPAIETDGIEFGVSNGVPAGTRFQLLISDAERDAHVAAYPSGTPTAMRNIAKSLIDTLRTYGFFITDNAGSPHFYFEDRNSGSTIYNSLSMQQITVSGKLMPDRMFDGLFSSSRLRAIVPSDQYVGTGRGSDYTYPTTAEVDYYTSKGLNCFRLPFLFERIANDEDREILLGLVDYMGSKGARCILDPHHYGVIGGVSVSNSVARAQLAAYWSQLADDVKDKAHVIFGLMNEPMSPSVPGGITPADWLVAANAAIAAIRAQGAKQLILVPGSYWTGGHSWVSSGNAAVMNTGVVDSENNYAFELHQYLDSDYSGTSPTVVTGAGATVLVAVTASLRAAGKKAFLGETGVGTSAAALAELEAELDYLDANRDVWLGVTLWAGGPWWYNASTGEDYFLNLDPIPDLSGPEKPQITTFKTHAGSVIAVGGGFLLLEIGDEFLLEDGTSKLLLE